MVKNVPKPVVKQVLDMKISVAEAILLTTRLYINLVTVYGKQNVIK